MALNIIVSSFQLVANDCESYANKLSGLNSLPDVLVTFMSSVEAKIETPKSFSELESVYWK